MKHESSGLLARSVFEYVDKEQRPNNENIIGGRFVLSIKQHGTGLENERKIYRTRTYAKRKGIHHAHIKTVRNKNIKILI